MAATKYIAPSLPPPNEKSWRRRWIDQWSLTVLGSKAQKIPQNIGFECEWVSHIKLIKCKILR